MKIKTFNVENKYTNEKYIAVTGLDIIMNFNSGKRYNLFGKEIKDTGTSTIGEYIIEKKQYRPSLRVFSIDNKNFTVEDIILYKDEEISIHNLEYSTEIFERISGSEDIEILSKGILKANENVYLNLNNFSVIDFNNKDKIILKDGVFEAVIKRETTEEFDKIKKLIKNYVEE